MALCNLEAVKWKYSYPTCSFIKKESLAQVFPCEFCKISENTCFYGIIPLSASSKHRCLHFSFVQGFRGFQKKRALKSKDLPLFSLKCSK